MTAQHQSAISQGPAGGSAAGSHGSDHRGVAEHRARMARLLEPLAARPVQNVPLGQALGAALGQDLVAPVSLPPFDNSQMDGFAVRAADFHRDGADGSGALNPRQFTVGEPIPAGTVPRPLVPGWAAPIMTGAVMPDGADAVVPVERAVPSAYPAPGETVVLPPTEPGTFVRHAGGDVAAGGVVLLAGTPLGPAQLGLAAGLGFGELPVRPPLRAAVVSTGAELAAPGHALTPGQIHDANGPLLAAALGEAGISVENLAVRTDDPDELLLALERLAGTSAEGRPDLVVTTGGVSQGAFEATKLALAGGDVEFSHLAMQPGGPQGLGTLHGVPVIAFPGNPVSCWISWEVLLRPVLTELLGAPRPRRVLSARLGEPLVSPAGKLQIRRGRLRRDGAVQLVGGPGSHLLGALAASDALVMVPEHVTELSAGAEVEVWLT